MDRWVTEQLSALGLKAGALNRGASPDSQQWVPVGMAGELHGKQVQGRLPGGGTVQGTYSHPATSVTSGGGRARKVSHVRLLSAFVRQVPTDDVTPEGAEAARLAALTPQPLGRPGGPGLWKVGGMQLPPYIQHVRDALMKSGHPESEATQMATGIVRDWANGHDGHGHPVSAPVVAQAKAQMAVYDKDRAKAKATRSTAMATNGTYDADGLDESWDGDHSDLPDLTGLGVQHFDSAAGDGEGGAVQRAAPKLGGGGRFQNLKASLAAKGATNPGALAAWIGRKKFGKEKFTKLAATARKAAPSAASRAGEMYRTYPLEDCRILTRADGSEYGSGRVVEAYAAVYNTEAEIHDHEGHYLEDIDPGAFTQAIRMADPARHGGHWGVTVLYNHGMTVHGTPAERFSLPAGVPLHVSSEGQGLLTRTEYAPTPLGDELLELVNMGALRTQSFTGGIIRSDPMLRGPGDRYRKVGGQLQRVRRLVLGLREYGLTPFAAYSGAEVLGVRMQLPGAFTEDGPDFTEYADATDEDGGDGLPPEDGSAARSTGNRLYALRTEELLAQHGIKLT